jgi:hypothetical protein
MSVSIWSKPLPHNSVSRKTGQAHDAHYWYVVRQEVRVEGIWHDISMQADQQHGITSANRRYAEYVVAAQARLQGAPMKHSQYCV